MQHDPFTSEQLNAFKSQVLAHVLSLAEDCWLHFRGAASLDFTRDELVKQCVFSCDMPLSSVRVVRGEWLAIGEVSGQHILFNSRAGIYLWSTAVDAGHTLQLWLSHPAYPTGWD